MRVVLDTNVIVSSFISPAGSPGAIVSSWRAGQFEVALSQTLLAEYEEALGYDRTRGRHRMTDDQVAEEVEAIRDLGILVVPLSIPAVVPRDRDDDHVLACAIAGEVDYVVSGDRDLLDLREYRGIRILSPAAFVALLKEEY